MFKAAWIASVDHQAVTETLCLSSFYFMLSLTTMQLPACSTESIIYPITHVPVFGFMVLCALTRVGVCACCTWACTLSLSWKLVGIELDKSFSVMETHSARKHPSQKPRWDQTPPSKENRRRRGRKRGGWTQEVIIICIEIGLTSSSTRSMTGHNRC